MPLSAICPNCNVANEQTAVQCSVCKTALGAMLVSDTKDGFRWFAIAAFVSLGIYLVTMILGLHPMTIIVALFYGPLLASYFARANIVWSSALGGMTMLVFVLFIALLDTNANTANRTITHLVGGEPEKLAKGVRLFFGVAVALVAALPVALTGASVGEHLSVRRRRKPAEQGVGGVYFK